MLSFTLNSFSSLTVVIDRHLLTGQFVTVVIARSQKMYCQNTFGESSDTISINVVQYFWSNICW